MPITERTSPDHLTREAQQLMALAESLTHSGSRLEDLYWENLFRTQLNKLLAQKKNDIIESALEHLLSDNPDAYEVLIEQVETYTESCTLTHQGEQYDVLLFCAPAVVWTRYQLPLSYDISQQQDAISKLLHTHIVAKGAQIALLPEMLGFDQMPQSFHETLEWTQRLGRAAFKQKPETTLVRESLVPEGMLADARFITGVIVAPKGQPLFRWQTSTLLGAGREQYLQAWQTACSRQLASIFTGCSIEYLQPDAYYVANRDADRQIRPLVLKAAATWLQTAAGLPGSQLRATIVACGDLSAEEYRIGFSTTGSTDVIYGSIWPILSKEEAANDFPQADQASVPEQITALLKELGIGEVRQLPGVLHAEFCDDCGAPYFPDPLGELQHPELPEELDVNPQHFH